MNGKTVSKTEIPAFYSDQEETDTRTILYCAYAQDQGYDTLRIGTLDGDIFFIAFHHADKLKITILFNTGTGNKK